MGLKKVWSCDRCGGRAIVDPMRELIERGEDSVDRPPGGWQVIAFNRAASIVHLLLCSACMARLYDEITCQHKRSREQAEELHRHLLMFEHPMTAKKGRAKWAEIACRAARTLLETDYSLFSDKSAAAKEAGQDPNGGARELGPIIEQPQGTANGALPSPAGKQGEAVRTEP